MNAKKILVSLLAVVMIIGCTVGATLAWLMDTTDPVTNTFTVGDIDIELKEHELDSENNQLLKGSENEVTSEDEYKILPGTTQPKDPFVRVKAGSEACWVFVKVEEKNNTTPKYVTYTIDSSWKKLENVADVVYYKEQAALTAEGAQDAVHYILTDNKVSYADTLTKENLNALYKEGTTQIDTAKQPELKFTAYAIQKVKSDGVDFTASDAWAELNKTAG